MKSVGTRAESATQVRDREFGKDPQVLLLASPRAPEVLAPVDAEDLARWIDGIRALPEVTTVEDNPTPNRGEHGVAVGVKTTEEGHYRDSVEVLSQIARETVPPNYRLAIAGIPPVEMAIATEMSRERSRILPVIAVSLFLVLLGVYRNLVLVAGALVAPLVCVYLLDGIQGYLGLSVDPVTSLLGPSILTVGVASSIHLLEKYGRSLRAGATVQAASHTAGLELRTPLLLTVITTVAGFLGLLASPIPAVNRFGILASVGVSMAVLATVIYLPSILRLWHRPRPTPLVPRHRSFIGHADLLHKLALPVMVVSASIAVAGAILMQRIEVDNDPIHVLAASHIVSRDARAVNARLGGSEVFELLLPPREHSDFFATARLIGAVTSLEGVVGPAGRPRTSKGSYQLLTFLLAPGSSAQRVELFDRAEALARDAGWSEPQATGLSVRLAQDSHSLVDGQRSGISMTLIALWIVMAIGFRSIWLGLLGLLPNVFPLIVIQGAMGLFEYPLSVASSMIGAVMLGLVVDDTIHFLHAYRQAHGAQLARMARAFREVRRPILITTLVLCVGFSATLLGELHATREFGWLAVATLLLALLADLMLLPALLFLKLPRFLRRKPRVRS